MKKSRILTAMVVVMALSSMAAAEWVPLPGDPIAISQIQEPLIVGDKAFTNFEVYGIARGGALVPDADTVFVQGGINDQTGDYGLKITSAWDTTDPGQLANVTVSFKVAVVDDPQYDSYLIEDVWGELVMADAQASGVINVSETVTDAQLPGGNVLATLEFSKQAGDGDANLIDHEVFGPTKEIWITKDISITSGTDDNGSAELGGFIQYYSQIPEPFTLGLLAVGAIPLLRRKRS